VTDHRRPDNLAFRPAEESDGPALAAFACSTGAWYEDDVETFIRTSALARALAPESPYRLIVFMDDERLIGVAGHHPELLLADTGEADESGDRSFRGMQATRLHVLALSVDQQGRRIGDGRRLSDLTMATLISEAMADRESAVLTAVVARDNLRSVALCSRHGLTSQIAYDASHLRVSGYFSRTP